MKYRVVVWDFDGTLADTFGCTVRAYNRLAAAYGARPIDDPQAVRGLTLRAFLRAYNLSPLKLPSLIRHVLAGQKEEMATVPLFPNLAAVLEGVRRAGRRMSVLSSNAEGNIRACLGANGVEGLFDAVVGYRRLFGKGRAIRGFVNAQGVPAGDVVYVGDEVRDVEAARKAGVAVAAVTWGYQTRDLLAGHDPDHLVDSPEQLLALLG
jgi:phosphoglycolate phosphatase